VINSAHTLVSTVAEKVALPSVYHRIRDLLAQPTASVEDFADIILLDPALSARLIRMTNSPFWAHYRKVETVQQAILMTGTFQLHDLLLSSLAIRAFSTIPSEIFDQESFWKSSIYCGIVARMLAEKCMLPTKERLFTAGLLHEIGHIVMFTKLSEQVQNILVKSTQTNTPLFIQERQSLGFDYGQVGFEIMQLWELPQSYGDIAKYHLEPELATRNEIEVQIINLAHAMMLEEEQSLDQPLSLYLESNNLLNTKLSEQDVIDIQITAHTYIDDVMDCLWPFARTSSHDGSLLNMRTES